MAALALGLVLSAGCGRDRGGQAGSSDGFLLTAPNSELRLENTERHPLQLPPNATGLALEVQSKASGILLLEQPPGANPLKTPGAPQWAKDPKDSVQVSGSNTPQNIEFRLPNVAAPSGLARIDLAWDGSEPLVIRSIRAIASAPTTRPNVLFISVDTLAAQHLSLHGYGRTTSPRLDAFATDAIVFENASSNGPWTLPSYVSQFSGLYPGGLRRTSDEPSQPKAELAYGIHDAATTLAEVFQANGYRTGAWVDNPWFSRATGLSQGFERFDDDDTWLPGPPTESGLRTIVPEIDEWLDSADPRPFFAFVNCLDVHAPYPLNPFESPAFSGPNGRTPPGPVPMSPLRGMFNTVHKATLPPGSDVNPGEAVDPLRLADAYDEGILRLDSIFGDWVQDLEQRGLLDTTIVIFSSDHGEAVGQHGWYFSHALLYENTLHVPLVLRLPDALYPAKPTGGLRVTAGVELLDLFPTLTELCGLSGAPPELDGQSLTGHFLTNVAAPNPRPRFASSMLFEGISVKHEGLKLISRNRSQAVPETLISMPESVAWISRRQPDTYPNGFDLSAVLASEQASRSFASSLPGLLPELTAHLDGRTSALFDLTSDPEELRDRIALDPERAEIFERLIAARRATDQARSELYGTLPITGPSDGDKTRSLLEELGYLNAND